MISAELKDKFLLGNNPKFPVTTQLVFLPEDLHSYHAFGLQQAVESFFQPNDGNKHIVTLQAPLILGALNLPHFEEWVKRTGSYFEGFVQHCETSDNHDPLPQEEIDKMRDQYEVLSKNNFIVDPTSLPKDPQERNRTMTYMFMTSSLFMVDKLVDRLQIEIAIESFSGKDLYCLLLRNRQLLKLDSALENAATTENVDTYLESQKGDFEKYLTVLARFKKDRLSSQATFLSNTIINKGAEGKTKILVPMEHIGFSVCYPVFQQKSKGIRTFSCPEPGFIDCGGYYPDVEEEILAQFIDGKKTLDRTDLLKLTSAHILIAALKAMPGDWSTRRGRMLSQVMGRSTPAELEEVIRLAITPDAAPEHQEQNNWALERVSPELQRVLSSVFRGKTNVERIVDFYSDKGDSIFDFDPWRK